MSTDGILEYQGTKRVLFRGDTSNIVFDTRTTSLGIGVTGSNNPSSNLYITGNAYVSSNLAIGGVMTMGVVNVAARHNLQAVTDMGNVTTHTVEFTNPDVGFTCTGTGVVKLPSGTTAQQPSTGLVAGMIRFNSDLNRLEFWDGTSWNTVSGYDAVEATGGTQTDVTDSGVKYRVHTFSTVGTSNFVVTNGGEVEYLIVAGGGGGGGRYHSGGGGAGGVIQHKGFSVTPQTYSIVVGDGGSAGLAVPDNSQRGSNGSNSTGFGQVALGGGGGGSNSTLQSGLSGGCGGGASGSSIDATYQGGNGTSGQGFGGGNGLGSLGTGVIRVGAGGGGAGGRGYDGLHGSAPAPGYGGDGIPSTISGTLEYYGGGGGGGGRAETTNMGLGGKGGGGTGAAYGTRIETAGEDGKGGGGGGSDNGSSGVGHGGSGVVIIRYRI